MRLQVFVGLALMGLTYLGLAEGSPCSPWASRSEVSSALADTLIGGAKCPSSSPTLCKGPKCPGYSPGGVSGTLVSAKLTGSKLYCGCSKSCGGGQYYTTREPCATSSTGVFAADAP